MSFYLMLAGSVLIFLGVGFFIFIMLYFGVTKKKYERIVSGYLSRGLPMPDVYTVFYHGGFFTSFLLVRFMRKALRGKRLGRVRGTTNYPPSHMIISTRCRMS